MPAPLKPIAQLLANVLAEDATYLDGLDLIAHLLSTGAVSLEDPVERKDPIDGSSVVATTLGQAVLDVAQVGIYRSGFYTQATAERLLAFDPKVFHRPGANGGLWLWDQLNGWAEKTEISRLGFSLGADAFMCTAIASLPHRDTQTPEAHEAFGSALRMGLEKTAQQWAQTPSDWLRRNALGALLLRQADGAWAWQAALAAGVDPKSAGRGGQPVWRELLPRSSNTPAVRGSLRAGVEAWVIDRLNAGQGDAQMADYHKKLAIARCFNFAGRDSWAELSQADRLKYLKSLPAESAGWDHEGAPFWAKGLRLKKTNPFVFVTDLASDSAWASHLSPVGRLVVWCFSAGTYGKPALPTTPPPCPEAWAQVKNTPLEALLTPVLGVPSERLSALMEQAQLDQASDRPPSPRRRPTVRL